MNPTAGQGATRNCWN